MEKQFSADDICSIIKSCGENGVSDLSLGKLRVLFKEAKVHYPREMIFDESVPVQQEVVSAEVTERDEVAHKEEMLAQMEIENPAEFERLMSAGDLIDSKVGVELDEGYSGA